MTKPPTPSALYLDLVKKCLLNSIEDSSRAVILKSVYFRNGTRRELLMELLSTKPDRELFIRRTNEHLQIILDHGTQEQISRVDVAGIRRLLDHGLAVSDPDEFVDQLVPKLQELNVWTNKWFFSVGIRNLVRLSDGESAASIVEVSPLGEALWKWIYQDEVEERERTVSAMADFASLDNTQECVETVLRDNVPGDMLEAGVWKGAQCILMRAVLKAHGITDRTVWISDSFMGLPEADGSKYPLDAAHRKTNRVKSQGYYAVSADQVRRNFSRLSLLDDQVRFLEGWFKDTLPHCPAQSLAVLRIDGDYYESNMQVLESLYDRVPVGGFVIIDDYGLKGMHGYQAVDDFRKRRGITEKLIPAAPGHQVYYWRKTALRPQ